MLISIKLNEKEKLATMLMVLCSKAKRIASSQKEKVLNYFANATLLLNFHLKYFLTRHGRNECVSSQNYLFNSLLAFLAMLSIFSLREMLFAV